MRKRHFTVILVCLAAFTALAADEPSALDVEISRGQAIAAMLGEGFGAIIGAGTVVMFVWRPIRRWRRKRTRDRLEHEAMLEVQRRAVEDRRIDDRIASALLLFRRTVVEAESGATLRALKTTLDTHTRDAQDQIKQVSGTVEALARGVAEIATRMERTARDTNERMDDFLRAMAVGNIPHFRAVPRDSEESGT